LAFWHDIPAILVLSVKVNHQRTNLILGIAISLEKKKFMTGSNHLDALRLHADAELRMVPNAAFNDVSNVLERRREIS
jgi:hypothetical protein